MEDPGQKVPPKLLRGEQAGGGAEGPRHRGRALWTQVGAARGKLGLKGGHSFEHLVFSKHMEAMY